MFGFGRGLPVAPTGEFPGFVNPMEPVTGESDLVVIGEREGEETAPEGGGDCPSPR